eukprot:TRINITY_DN1791_c1_g1_i2.p1 TRINITY_DN1791_c1_g1~~TRINITY_DN1791_c1_g1_i2.p1  ORF type:complete len:857 (+),score=161.05 TRINITY_DN1791_c1_g1_i2:405-2975(+)
MTKRGAAAKLPTTTTAPQPRGRNSTVLAHGVGASGGTGGDDTALFVAAHSIDRNKRGSSAGQPRAAFRNGDAAPPSSLWQRAAGRFTAAAAARAAQPGLGLHDVLPRRFNSSGSLPLDVVRHKVQPPDAQRTLSRVESAPVRRPQSRDDSAQGRDLRRSSDPAPAATQDSVPQPAPPAQTGPASQWRRSSGTDSDATRVRDSPVQPAAEAAQEPAPKEPPEDKAARAAAADGQLAMWTFQEEESGGKGGGAGSEDRVAIHVYDEVNGVSRDFIARRDALLNEMKYFRAYLTNDCSLDDLDISVHCDINIFRWLMEYVHSPPHARPQIETPIAVSILISSEFLEMSELVTHTLQYVAKHLQDIIKLPIDLECINRGLVARLAAMFTDINLDTIRDRKDKIVGALFLHKLESLLAGDSAGDGESSSVLMRCALCGKLYTSAQKSWSVCTKSAPHITFHGNAVSEHSPDNHWDVNAYLARLRCKRMSWREIYWRMWALVNHGHCKACNRHYSYAELAHCAYHVSLPSFPQGASVGVYPCCGAEVRRFESGAAAPSGLGCCARYHSLSGSAADAETGLLSIVQRHAGILIPWTPQRGRGEQSAAELELGITPQRNSDYAPPQESPAVHDTDSDSSSTSDDAFGAEWRRRSRWGQQGAGGKHAHPGDDLRRLFHSFPKPQQRPAQEAAASCAASSASGSDAPPRRSASGRAQQPSETRRRRKSRKSSGRQALGGGAAASTPMTSGSAASAPSAPAGVREGTGPSTDWWARLGAKGRTAYFLDTQREDDSRRFSALSAVLDKRRRDRVDDRFDRKQPSQLSQKPSPAQKAAPRRPGDRAARPLTARSTARVAAPRPGPHPSR